MVTPGVRKAPRRPLLWGPYPRKQEEVKRISARGFLTARGRMRGVITFNRPLTLREVRGQFSGVTRGGGEKALERGDIVQT